VFDGKGGIGAIELIARISSLDLDDSGVNGGQITTGVVGVNWFPNPVTLLSLNAISSSIDGAGRITGAQMRAQIAF
jgi:phosphate-selective porin OprO/OprP